MPKKTKRQKIIAEYRRKLSAVSPTSPGPSQSSIPTSDNGNIPGVTGAFSLSSLSAQPKRQQQIPGTLSLDPAEFSAIKKDLLITLFYTTLILVGQIVLWKTIG